MAGKKNEQEFNEWLFGNVVFPDVDVKNKKKAYVSYMAEDLSKSIRMGEWNGEGIGDTIPENQPEKLLQVNGWMVVYEWLGKYYVGWGGLGGPLDGNYYPTECIVNNPWLGVSKTFKVGKDCVIIRNDSFGMGLARLFGRYNKRRIETEITLLLLSIKMRDPAALVGNDDTTKLSIDKYLKDLENGELGSIAESGFWEDVKALATGAGGNASITQLIELEQYLKASKDNFIGINGNFNMKRESITASESDLNEDGLLTLIDDMKACREEGIKQLKEVFGIDWSFKLKGQWEVKEAQREAELDLFEDMNTEADELTEEPLESDITAPEGTEEVDSVEDTPMEETSQEEPKNEPEDEDEEKEEEVSKDV